LNAKRKGSRNEHRSIRLLELSGYICTRAAASLGTFDVIGIGPTDICLVQVKTNAWPRAEEMEQLALFKAPPNTRKLIHRWRDRQRIPDVKEL
jgi:Holliday junction resolvase